MNIYTLDKAEAGPTGYSAELKNRVAADSQALQEIISVLKDPFQTSCDICNGLGFVRSGQDCPTCDGTGKVLDECFR